MKILLVDDEPLILQSIGKFLIEFGYEVVYARDGVEALSLLDQQNHPGLIISDIRMPRIDGLEFLRLARLRAPEVPVLLMTGFGDENIAIEAFHKGACDYMKKPVKLRELLTCIERVEKQQQLESEMMGEMNLKSERLH